MNLSKNTPAIPAQRDHTRKLFLWAVSWVGVPLTQSLSQISYWSALHLTEAGVTAMKVRGRMQEGMVADITVFNPETVTDNATYKAGEHLLPSIGIPYVIVNGHIVVRDSKAQELKVGQPIRYSPKSKGRHVPATTNQWLKNFSIDDGGIINPNKRAARDVSQPNQQGRIDPCR